MRRSRLSGSLPVDGFRLHLPMKGDEIAGDLALEKVDLLLKVLDHPQGVGGRLICDLPDSTEPRGGFFALVLRDLDESLRCDPGGA